MRPGEFERTRNGGITGRFLKRPRVILAFTFDAVLVVLCFVGRLPWGVLGVYAVSSAIAFGTYGYDKFSAKTGRWRTPEKTLLTLGLIGGWPGAMLAQEWIRHKSAKGSFQVAFWLTVVINCLVLAWLVVQAPEQVEGLIRNLTERIRGG